LSDGYDAWLLVQENPNGDLVNIVRDLGLYSVLDLRERPRTTLRLVGDRPALESTDVEAFFEWISGGRAVLAFTEARIGDVRRFHNRKFFHRGRWFRMTCDAGRSAADRDPYARRILRFEQVTAALQEDVESADTDIRKSPEPAGPALYLEPLSLALSPRTFDPILRENARALSGVNAVFLPPTRSDWPGTYFDRELLEVRDAIRSVAGIDQQEPAPATALSAWTLADDPLFRDLLMEGGALEAVPDDRSRTRLRLRLGGSSDPLSEFRRRWLSGQGSGYGSAISATLADDLVTAAFPGMLLSQEPAAVDWGLATIKRIDVGAPEAGMFNELLGVRDALPLKNLRTVVDEKALFQARGHNGRPNHDFVERLFLHHFFRCPWSDSTDQGPWRLAFVELVGELAGKPVAAQQRVEQWNAFASFALTDDKTGPTLMLHHPGGMSDQDLLELRLQLPLGTIFRRRGTLHLQDTVPRADSVIDAGFALG
jgi:hypothetical protein